MKMTHVMAGVAAWLLAAAGVLAAPIQNTSGLASPATTITFDELVFAGGTSITNQYAGLGLTFSPSLRYDSQGAAQFPGITGHYLGNNGPCCDNPFSILFGGDITAAAFGVATNPATTLFEALDDGLVVESFSAPTNFDGSTNSFFGFSGVTFDEIRVTVGGDQQILIDNVQSGSVPEPTSLALLGLGLAGFAASRYRRK